MNTQVNLYKRLINVLYSLTTNTPSENPTYKRVFKKPTNFGRLFLSFKHRKQVIHRNRITFGAT
ncbi:hypothetical protein LSA03_07590 [Pediococcus argentinicus]|nr:hypothetical protein LSA03_07590 [Pediococcus argentinicus]